MGCPVLRALYKTRPIGMRSEGCSFQMGAQTSPERGNRRVTECVLPSLSPCFRWTRENTKLADPVGETVSSPNVQVDVDEASFRPRCVYGQKWRQAKLVRILTTAQRNVNRKGFQRSPVPNPIPPPDRPTHPGPARRASDPNLDNAIPRPLSSPLIHIISAPATALFEPR